MSTNTHVALTVSTYYYYLLTYLLHRQRSACTCTWRASSTSRSTWTLPSEGCDCLGLPPEDLTCPTPYPGPNPNPNQVLDCLGLPPEDLACLTADASATRWRVVPMVALRLDRARALLQQCGGKVCHTRLKPGTSRPHAGLLLTRLSLALDSTTRASRFGLPAGASDGVAPGATAM